MMKQSLLSISLTLLTGLSSLSGHEGEHAEAVVPQNGVLTGNGLFLYMANSTWGDLGAENKIGPTHGGVAVSKEGKVYVSTDANHGILVYDSEGKSLGSIGEDVIGVHGMTLNEENGEEFLYCAHLKGESKEGPGRFVKLNLNGEVQLQIPNEKTGEIPGGLKGVTSVAVAADGTIFLSCGYGSNYILKFDAEGKFLSHFGGKGNKKDQFNRSHGISIDNRFEETRLLVVDREKKRLVHFDLEGNFLGEYATNLRRPCAVSFHGDYCAVAELQARVTILDKKGTPVAFLGDNPNQKQWANFKVEAKDQTPGIFSAPHGLSYDAEGNLYVQDWNKVGRLTKLTLKQ